MDSARVFIVEDEALIAMDLKDRLEQYHYIVCGTVARGEEAVRQIEQWRPDAVLMDINLAGTMNGIETAAKLREKLDVPVVYLTAFSDPELVKRAAHTAPYGYLLKPFNEQELYSTLEMALFKHGMERRLRGSERRFRTLFEQAAVGVAQVSVLTGRFECVNRRFCEIVGRSQDAVLALALAALTHPDDLQAAANDLAALVEGGARERTGERRYLCPDGSTVWVQVTAAPLWEPQGTPDSYVAVVQDLTDRKAAEAAQLQAKKMESLGVLASGIAHDFNNILQCERGHAVLAAQEIGPLHSGFTNIQAVEVAAKQAVQLTQQLMACGGVGHVVPTVLHLNEAVRDTMVDLEEAVPAQVRLEFEASLDLPLLRIDRKQVHQVVKNLIVNAYEALGERRGTVRIVTKTLALSDGGVSLWTLSGVALAPGLYAVLEVCDDGCGIAPELLDRIFDMFYTTKFVGRGLGLAVVVGVLRRYGAGIQVESRVERGTTFRVAFPAATPSSDVPMSAEKVKADKGGVLVIDDDGLVRVFVEAALCHFGCRVYTAEDGERGVQLYRDKHQEIDLVLLDFEMPDLKGAEVFGRLRAVNPDVKVVLVSGYVQTGAVKSLLQQGLSGYLQKPFLPTDLFDEVAKHVRS